MSYNKNVVEDALFQIRNLEETLQENAKGILQSTMSEEIKQLVKESLREQDEEEVDQQTPEMPDDEMAMDDDEMAMDDDEMAMDDDEMAMDDDEMAMDDDEMAMDDDETIDMTGASDAEVMRVFKAMGDEDGIIVKKEGENIHLTDGDNEYMIQLGESEEGIDPSDYDFNELDEEDDDYMLPDQMDDMNSSEVVYEIEVDDTEDDYMSKYEMDEMDDMYKYEMDEMDDMDASKVVYEIEVDDTEVDDTEVIDDPDALGISDEDDEDDYELGDEGSGLAEEDYLDSVMESVKKSLKKSVTPKGVGIGRGPKFSYDKKPNMNGGFNEKRKEAFGKGTKAMGTGKARFEYKEEKEYGGNKGDFKRRKGHKIGDEKGHYKDFEKSETKEAVRTNSYTRANKVGNRKGSNQNVNRTEIRVRPNTRVNEDVEILKAKNEEYRKALDVFRTKINEVAIFNSNLAYATRLFTEHSTTKQEKINILRRFDNVETLKESKNLYRTIKSELGNGSSSETKLNESIERTVNRSVETGSAVNLIESKTYENPQFLRMKDLMAKIK